MARGPLIRSSNVRLAALPLVALVSCGAPARPPPKVERPPVEAETAPPFVSPARWAYYPHDATAPIATLVVPESGAGATGKACIVLTVSGDRWLVHGPAATPCSGPGTASASPLLGEPLVGAVKTGNGFLFISATGTVYEAADALAPFTRSTKPEKPLVNVASAGTHITGVDASGKAFFFDETALAWKRASQPEGSRIARVGIDETGRALGLGLPERLLTSTDAGRTFAWASPIPARIGAADVLKTPAGDLGVLGAIGKLVWKRDGSFATTTDELAAVSVAEVSIRPSSAPMASALREVHGQITGDHYFDLRYPDSSIVDPSPPPDDSGGAAAPPSEAPYVLARGPIGGPLDTRHLSGMGDCSDFRLGARDHFVVIACAHPADGTTGTDIGLRVYQSTDAGDTFSPVAELITPSFSDVYLAVGADGSALVTNVCRAGGERRRHKDDETDDACKPKAPVYVHITGGKTTTSQGSAPHLAYGAFSPLISADGRFFFLGRRTKDDRASVFVSTDGGRNFDDRTLDPPPPADAPPTDDQGPSDVAQPTDFGYLELAADYSHLTIDESGTLGVLAESQAGYAWVTADADVHLLNIGLPPEPASMGGFGKRLIALGYGSNDGVTRAWESNDGGGSFAEIATTGAVMQFFQSGGDTSIACDAGGCILGDTLARVGWEGQAEIGGSIVDTSVPELQGKLGGGVSCELTPKTQWTPVRGFTLGVTYPRLSDLARGKFAWSLATQDATTHAIDVTSASVPDKESDPSAVITRSLLGAFGGGGTTAWLMHNQAEGYVAMRALVPDAKGFVDKKPINGVEIAWANFYTATFAHRTLSDTGTWDSELIGGQSALRGLGGMTFMTPSIASIAGPGVVFRASWKAPKSFFIDAQSRTTAFDYPDWASLGLVPQAHPDAAMAGTDVIPAMFVETPGPDGQPVTTSFALARKLGGGTSYQAQATAFADMNAETDWAYFDMASGVEAINPQVDGSRGDAFGMYVKADGTLTDPVALPTLLDLPAKPRACTADDRKNTPRTYMPVFSRRGTLLYPDGRRAIVVNDAPKDAKSLAVAEPNWFLTDGAVLYGTPKDPCVAALRGSSPGRGLVVVVAGDMTHAWMFRPTGADASATCEACPDDPTCQCAGAPRIANDPRHRHDETRAKIKPATSNVEWRPMTCSYKTDVTPPPDLTSNLLVHSPEDAY